MEHSVELTGVSKTFAEVPALDAVDLRVAPGEVHGLLGENGSGKSTLIKVLAGFYTADSGALKLGGQAMPLPLPPGAARSAGLEFVHQDLGLIESLSVVENLRVAEMGGRRMSINWAQERRNATAVFERYGIDLDPRATVADVRPVQRAQLAIARAMEGMRVAREREGGTARGMLVLDEPTVFLPREEVEQLFDLMREIAASGASVLFVSHDIDEVKRVTDRVTVLRDGRNVDTVRTGETSHDELVELIIGRRLEAMVPQGHAQPDSGAAAVASVTGLRSGPVSGLDLELRAGEVVGITGLLGSGFERVPYALFGAEPGAGRMTFGDREFDLAGLVPRRAVEAGMALIPADRKNDGSAPGLSVTDNVTMPTLKTFRRGGVLGRGAMRRQTAELMERFDVRPRDPSLLYGALSGGNQQKALIAKWLVTEPRLLLLHEPTQGVDIGARAQIFELVREYAAGGRAVLCASSDHEQLAAVCDRVLVISRGRLSAELKGAELTKERITERCLLSNPLEPAVG
jgi:ribose transport system ATP-binding protein